VKIDKNIVVLILFFEKAYQTIACVKSFIPSGVKIYILNNGSSERNANIVNRFCAPYDQVTIFKSDKNLGVSGGRNFLIRKTDEEFLFFVDNDIVIKTNNWLEIAGAGIDKNYDAEAYTPKIFNVWENRFLPFFSIDIIDNKMVYHYMDEAECVADTRLNCFPGGASIVRRKLFERLGLYDSDMFVGFEDYEFAIRGIRTEPIFCVPLKSVTLFHDHAVALNNKFDKNAVAVRYRVSSHEDSIKKILARHGVEFFNDKGWRKWVAEQQRVFSKRNFLKTKLSGFLKMVKSRTGLN